MRQAKLPSFYVCTINSIRFVDVELEETLKIADALGIYAYDAYLLSLYFAPFQPNREQS
jgi:hypothetical protein